MKTLLICLGLFVLGPATAFAAPHPLPRKAPQCTVEFKDNVVVSAVCEGGNKKKPKKKRPPPPRDPTPGEVKAYIQSISNIDPVLVLAVCRVESNFHTMAMARGKGSGHYGLMQLAPATARAMGFRGPSSDLYEWRINVRFGARYLAYLQQLHGKTPAAIASYNSGAPFYVRRPGKPVHFINQGYVNSVMRYYGVFAKG